MSPKLTQMRTGRASIAHDPLGLVARGFRFIVRGNDATWRRPSSVKPGDVDVTDIEDTAKLAAVFVRERAAATGKAP